MSSRALSLGAAPALCLSLLACGSGGSAKQGSLLAILDQAQASGQLPTLDLSTSVAGTDGDANGVRDDLDQVVAALPDSAAQRAALIQLARGLQGALTLDPTDAAAVASAASALNRAVACAWTAYAASAAPAKVALVQELSVNTMPRVAAYDRFNAAMDGTVTPNTTGGCDE